MSRPWLNWGVSRRYLAGQAWEMFRVMREYEGDRYPAADKTGISLFVLLGAGRISLNEALHEIESLRIGNQA